MLRNFVYNIEDCLLRDRRWFASGFRPRNDDCENLKQRNVPSLCFSVKPQCISVKLKITQKKIIYFCM
jgi:hypothetical protein